MLSARSLCRLTAKLRMRRPLHAGKASYKDTYLAPFARVAPFMFGAGVPNFAVAPAPGGWVRYHLDDHADPGPMRASLLKCAGCHCPDVIVITWWQQTYTQERWPFR